MEDTQKEFEQLEQELLDGTLQELLEDREPVADADTTDMPPLEAEEPKPADEYDMKKAEARVERRKEMDAAAKRLHDKWMIGLMVTASALCLGIIAVMIYWLEHFFG